MTLRSPHPNYGINVLILYGESNVGGGVGLDIIFVVRPRSPVGVSVHIRVHALI